MSNLQPVVWKDPPPSVRSKQPPAFLEVLRTNPGRWGVVAIAKSGSMVVTLRKRYGLEAKAVRMVDGRFEIYARQPPNVVRIDGRGAERRASDTAR